MHTDINGHEPSIWFMNTGKAQPGRPALGSWLTYGLGSESQDLPAYVVLSDPGGHPVDGVRNWSNGWLPPLYQGTVIRPREPRILNLDPPAHLRGQRQAENLALLADLNRQHLARHPHEADLEARIASYELAARMQSAAKEALDISTESEAIRKLYGIDEPDTTEYGTRCLIARRLVERGVRFVQLFMGGQPWDNHTNIRETLPGICRRTDKPAAALVADLKARGLLDSTLVHWGGEIGRLPVTEGEGAMWSRPQWPGFQHVAGRRRYQGRHHLRSDRRSGAPRRGRPGLAQRLSGHALAPVRHGPQPLGLSLQRAGAKGHGQPPLPRGERVAGVAQSPPVGKTLLLQSAPLHQVPIDLHA